MFKDKPGNLFGEGDEEETEDTRMLDTVMF